MADVPPYPLYGRSYLLYRVSPLHHGDAPLLREPALNTHAKRLREQLKGDNVRGVDVDFAATEGALPNLGPLDACSWDVIGDDDAWIDRHRQLLHPDASQLTTVVPAEHARGIHVSLDYETQSYNALLLRDPSSTAAPDGFTSLPLLLVKMPSAIRDIFLNYIRTSFDAHVAPLRLSSAFVTSTLETYFRRLTASTSTQTVQDVIRQLQVQLSFPTATTLLRHLDVTMAGRDVPGFLSRGRLLRNAKDRPFTAALAAYMREHLALDISHPKVRISRISCASFVLATDRLKLMAPDIADVSIVDSDTPEGSAGELAVQDFYASLVKEATGTGKFLSEDLTMDRRSSTPSSSTSASASRRKRAVSNVAAGSRTSKRSKAREKENRDGVLGDAEMADA
ncbi:uncharacterized protein CC84DRAFT_1091965 [Paraphaeosphaeria sporulosa]|uniref:Kinetochore complex Sim4 subunit Fta1-domain-containing protein n=1 Tax=Paraphaeosphaeria sporulosa TaxID=1460663 RepID=A0A177CGX2_9PLEO|nr:uncharacterized protein CC84DRAFT_1091965 [Paraphaeosphaeria sporulosa]OAG06099.1 hypothetical protein CC84DRAFT_1091965 [Paraphaeosphaeria sporulosa]